MQADLLNAVEKGDVGTVQRCLAAGVSASCTDEVGAPWRPMPLTPWECLHASIFEMGLRACSHSGTSYSRG
jgi:hypothetical protein